jgi:uncharacterized protein YdhG (YjbR/CyaY superfamily)
MSNAQSSNTTIEGNLVHFGAFKEHVGFYPTPSGIDAFKDELSGYKLAKGSVQFPLDRPVPYDLIRRIVRFRVNEEKAKAKNCRGNVRWEILTDSFT